MRDRARKGYQYENNPEIPMFKIADEGYAMANAIDALKEVATAVIDSNENDGVAKWLSFNFC
ncbi:MAG: HAD family hydrolase [Lachnospiraceae bacterium]|nr:HAD family hydrolase [Lachnospiraceae bacterium]